jgi:hypothetical protein
MIDSFDDNMEELLQIEIKRRIEELKEVVFLNRKELEKLVMDEIRNCCANFN